MALTGYAFGMPAKTCSQMQNYRRRERLPIAIDVRRNYQDVLVNRNDPESDRPYRSAGRQSHGAIEPDADAIEHRILANMGGERRILGR